MDRKIKVTLKRRPATERLRIILLGLGLKKQGKVAEAMA